MTCYYPLGFITQTLYIQNWPELSDMKVCNLVRVCWVVIQDIYHSIHMITSNAPPSAIVHLSAFLKTFDTTQEQIYKKYINPE